MPTLGATEILLLLLVVLVLFGAKRLPDLSRSVGRSMRILKSETRALHADDDVPDTDTVDADDRDRRRESAGA